MRSGYKDSAMLLQITCKETIRHRNLDQIRTG